MQSEVRTIDCLGNIGHRPSTHSFAFNDFQKKKEKEKSVHKNVPKINSKKRRKERKPPEKYISFA